VADLGKNAYIKQNVLYLNNKDYGKAYEFSKEFVQKFPAEMIAHFLLAKAAFCLGRHEEAVLGARKAFNLAADADDMLSCAILASTAYYELKEYGKGLELLKQVEKTKTSEELEELLFIFSLAMEDEKEAMKHVQDLYKLNKKAAEEFIAKFIMGS